MWLIAGLWVYCWTLHPWPVREFPPRSVCPLLAGDRTRPPAPTSPRAVPVPGSAQVLLIHVPIHWEARSAHAVRAAGNSLAVGDRVSLKLRTPPLSNIPQPSISRPPISELFNLCCGFDVRVLFKSMCRNLNPPGEGVRRGGLRQVIGSWELSPLDQD